MKNDELCSVELQRMLLACCNISLCANHKFLMERVITFSIEHVLVQNALQLHRNFGVPAAFHLCSSALPVRLLLSDTVIYGNRVTLSGGQKRLVNICCNSRGVVWCKNIVLSLSFHILVADIHTTCLSRLPGVENGSILGRDNLGL